MATALRNHPLVWDPTPPWVALAGKSPAIFRWKYFNSKYVSRIEIRNSAGNSETGGRFVFEIDILDTENIMMKRRKSSY